MDVFRISSAVRKVWDEEVSDFASVLQQNVDTIVKTKEFSQLSGQGESVVVKFIHPVVKRVLIALDSEDIRSEALKVDAGLV